MPKETLGTFLIRHRFKPSDIVPSVNGGISMDDYRLLRIFPGEEVFFGSLFDKGLLELRRAFYLAEYMATSSTDQPQQFAQLVSTLGKEGWAFALRYSPYHKVSAALENLDLVQSAMLEAGLSLNTAKAGMESAMAFQRSETRSYEREESKATINLLNYSALYATYVDICRRLRKYAGLSGSSAYSRAIRKIIGKNAGKHEFIKDLRNFILHHHLLRPYVSVTYEEDPVANLYLDSDSLLVDGYDWKSGARGFIQSNQKIEIIKITTEISRDMERLVEFHQKMIGRHLRQDKNAYELYLYERVKIEHLSKSMTNIEAIFKLRPRSIISKIIEKKIIENILNSSLTDNQVREIIGSLADRHKNLPLDMKMAIDREITKILRSRTKFPKTKAYLSGRQFPRRSKNL